MSAATTSPTDLSIANSYHELTPYSGEERLVFCFDIGTTMTASTVIHLSNGHKPRIFVVNEYPGQSTFRGDSKIPTQIRYDRQTPPRPIKFGEHPNIVRSMQNTDLVWWFKLHLHPESMRVAHNIQVPPLPPNVTIEAVYADMLAYIFVAATGFAETRIVDIQAQHPWPRLQATFQVCLAIPNGWDLREQNFLRQAVVRAGIFTSAEASTRLHFVSESEASVHFAVHCGQSTAWLHRGTVFAVCDVGGSTTDTTVYRCIQETPELKFEEVTARECVQAGGALVDAAAKVFLEDRFRGTPYASPTCINHGVKEFERNTKRRYIGDNEEQYVQLDTSGTHDDYPDRGVEDGHAILSSKDMKEIFSPSVTAIASSIRAAIVRAGSDCQTAIIVGGFGESPYLRRELGLMLKSVGVNMFKIDQPTQKAAAEGAAIWFCRRLVVARAARETYGICCRVPVQSGLASHRERQHTAIMLPDGCMYIPGKFSPVVQRNQVVRVDEAHRSPYRRSYKKRPSRLEHFRETIVATNEQDYGDWCRPENGDGYMPGFRAVCTIRANLSGVERGLEQMISPTGKKYWRVQFEVEIFFGLTALAACIVWKEGGVERRSPAEFIPESII